MHHKLKFNCHYFQLASLAWVQKLVFNLPIEIGVVAVYHVRTINEPYLPKKRLRYYAVTIVYQVRPHPEMSIELDHLLPTSRNICQVRLSVTHVQKCVSSQTISNPRPEMSIETFHLLPTSKNVSQVRPSLTHQILLKVT